MMIAFPRRGEIPFGEIGGMTASQPYADEGFRLETLRRYGVLDTIPDQALNDLTELAAQICEAPIATISLIDERRQWFGDAARRLFLRACA
jgi:hypothetical protein